MEFAKTSVEPVVRKMDFGKWSVCSVCGQGFGKDEFNLPALHPECKNSRMMTLREYIETVKGEKFDSTQWRMECQPINVTAYDAAITIGGA